jgi:hypothetical protein
MVSATSRNVLSAALSPTWIILIAIKTPARRIGFPKGPMGKLDHFSCHCVDFFQQCFQGVAKEAVVIRVPS